jgi:DNA-binding NarL/FixJ family response regulator
MPTEREQECIALTWFGLKNREIAARLFVEPHTIDNYMWLAHRRLGVAECAGGGSAARTRAAIWLFRACQRATGHMHKGSER